ncbi:MAG: hypothetical protein M0R17_10595 [Candidatus Omnitrophica bacterium]|jgi:hypothetical protein|nr:hypothetical protein [Candidatus Omnitrophota bacterium]
MELDNLVALVRDEIKNNKKTKSGIKSYRTIKDKSDLLRKNEPMAHNDPDMYDVKFVSGLTEGEEDNNKTLRSKIANHYNVSPAKLSILKLDGTDSIIDLSRALNLPIDDTNFSGVKETIRKLSERESGLTEGEENDYYIVGQLKNSFSQVFGEETFGDDTEEYDLMQSLDDETSEKLIDDLERQGITVTYDEADDSLTVVNHGKPNKEIGIEINEEEKTDEYKYRIITPEGKIKYAGTDESSWLSLKEAKRKVDRSKGEMIYEFDKKGNRMWEVLDENINEETNNDELQEGFDDDDFEQYVKNHLPDIDDNMNRYGYNLSDLSKMYNYYDLAHLLDADTRIMKDVDVSYWSNFLRQLMEEYLPHHKEENEEDLNESTSEKEPW